MRQGTESVARLANAVHTCVHVTEAEQRHAILAILLFAHYALKNTRK